MNIMARIKNHTWAERREILKTRPTKPTMTDQSQADGTDRHVIVTRFLAYGQVSGSAKPPIYGDFTGIPQDLKTALAIAREAKHLESRLPKELQGMTLDQLTELTREELITKLTPAPIPEPKKEEAK